MKVCRTRFSIFLLTLAFAKYSGCRAGAALQFHTTRSSGERLNRGGRHQFPGTDHWFLF
jgi:hypothetical protein